MNPTLFADDIEQYWLPLKAPYAPPSGMESVIENLVRILPRHCPGQTHAESGQCPGFLYPDPPDWWAEENGLAGRTDGKAEWFWREHIDWMWRAMGIVK